MSDVLSERLKASLGGAYTLERELGGGGMSRVFVAEELSLGRKVVVKVLPPELSAGVSVERFKREIQMAARLQHPHIVPVLSAGDSDGVPYYTMPFVEGSSLRARLARGALSITETVGILREVARALAYAHERGVVHRDIKPDNVLLQGGSAVVTDFGIAKAISAARTGGPGGATLTQHGTSLGTPAYMAPEQMAGDPTVDHRADIYAYGVMAYEMLSGHTPFHSLTPQRMLAAQMSERPVPIGEVRTDTPPLLAELVMRCLEKDPASRPQGAADIARVLGRRDRYGMPRLRVDRRAGAAGGGGTLTGKAQRKPEEQPSARERSSDGRGHRIAGPEGRAARGHRRTTVPCWTVPTPEWFTPGPVRSLMS